MELVIDDWLQELLMPSVPLREKIRREDITKRRCQYAHKKITKAYETRLVKYNCKTHNQVSRLCLTARYMPCFICNSQGRYKIRESTASTFFHAFLWGSRCFKNIVSGHSEWRSFWIHKRKPCCPSRSS